MGGHYKLLRQSNPATFEIEGIDHIPSFIWKGNRAQQLHQRDTFLIYKLKALNYLWVNKDLEFCPFS